MALFLTTSSGFARRARVLRVSKALGQLHTLVAHHGSQTLHGSFNWIVRIHGRQPTAKDLTGEGRLRNVFLDAQREIERILYTRGGGGAGRKSWHTWPVVVLPIYAKRALISRLQRTWDDARVALSQADRVIFYGYSLPQLDIEAEKLIRRGLSANRGPRLGICHRPLNLLRRNATQASLLPYATHGGIPALRPFSTLRRRVDTR